MLKIRKNSRIRHSLFGLFCIGLIFVAIFFIGGNEFLLKQNIFHWPKAIAKVISVEQKNVCENPEISSACYAIFFIKFSYYVNGVTYINQMEQMYATGYSVGKILYVYYSKDDPQMAFVEGRIPNRLTLYSPLIVGFCIIIPIMFFWLRLWGKKT